MDVGALGHRSINDLRSMIYDLSALLRCGATGGWKTGQIEHGHGKN
jgi:hypothetical protein